MSRPPRTDPTPRPHRPADRRAQLAAVASALFTERGYRSVGVEDIAAAAGITGPALYRHFPDKRSILAEVVLAGIADLEACTAAAQLRPPGQRTEAVLEQVAAEVVRRPGAALLWRWAAGDLGDDDRGAVRARSAALLLVWSDGLVDEGRVASRTDAELAAWAVMSVMGSPTSHRTRLGRGAHAALLVAAAERVIATDLASARTQSGGEPVADVPVTEALSRREQVLAAASDLFRRNGYSGVSIADIGAAVGIAGPSVYRHFASKSAVLVAICRRSASRLEEAADAVTARDEAGGPAAVLRALAASYVEVLTGTPDLVVAFTSDHTRLSSQERAELLDAQRTYVVRWVRVLVRAHPELTEAQGRVLVHVALELANDVSRTRRLTTRPGWRAELVALMVAAMDVTELPDPAVDVLDR